MFITPMWYKCTEHDCTYPQGSMCPRCDNELQNRSGAALEICWEDVVPVDQRLDFIRNEELYCRDEEHAFRSYDGRDVNKKEQLRVAVLEKRAKFLQLFMETTITINEELLNVHKSEDSN